MLRSSAETLGQIERYAAHNYEPLVVADRGRGVMLWDPEGNEYLDLLGSYAAASLGHCHPRIVGAIKNQAERLGMVSRTTPTPQFGEFCQKAVEFFGITNGTLLPALGGHEAVEKAIKIVRKWGYEIEGVEPDKAEIISCIGSFHGRTYGALSLMNNEQYKSNFGPFLPGFIHIPFGDANTLMRAITPNTVAFFVEPIQGEGGVVIPNDGYLAEVETICMQKNVSLVVDEIQTGFGRTGCRLVCERETIQPDLVIVGKGLSGGMGEVSAVIGDKSLMGILEPGDDGSTFAGNPMGCAAALEAMKVMEEENLCANARETGNQFMAGLRKIKSPHVKEVRGRGLMLGIEVTDSVVAKALQLALLNERVICGLSRNVLRFSPPLIITKDQIDWALPRIEKVLHGK